MDDERAAEPGELDARAQLRLGATIALVAVLLLLPLQLLHLDRGVLPALLVVYVVHTSVSLAVLLLSFTAVGARHADRLSLVFVLGLAANLLFYLYFLPYMIPTYPSLISNALTCLLIAGAVLYQWSTRRMLFVCLLACTGFALVGATLALRGLPAAPFGLTLSFLGIGAALAIACARVIGRLRLSLLRRQDELADLSARLMSVQEEQMRQVSRELHEELGQSLTAVSSYLWLLEQRLPSQLGDLRARAGEARHVLTRTLGEMRELSQLLRPPGLDVYGLSPSLEAQLKAFGDRYGVAATFASAALPDRLPPEIETAVYRITEEALTNVARHAHARRVHVALTATADELRLEVQDDGVGFPSFNGGPRRGIGLIAVRERVRALGGSVDLSSADGACLAVRLPLPSAIARTPPAA